MNLCEEINLRGHFKIFSRVVGEKEWVKVVDKDNLIVTDGKTLVRDLISGEKNSINVKSFAVGKGSNPPTVANTGLASPVKYNATHTYKQFEEYSNDTPTSVTFLGYLSSVEPYDLPVNLTEIGLFTGSGSTKGTMYCRTTFNSITKTNAIELMIEYTLMF